jgi:hypothetical protein
LKIIQGHNPWIVADLVGLEDSASRFDFLLATPDVHPTDVRYIAISEANELGSSHAPVLAEVVLESPEAG